MTLGDFIKSRQERVNQFLDNILPTADQQPTDLHEAMRYAVLNGGKRIRPLLVYATGEAFGASLDSLDYPGAAVELIHAYSLVHDDLPSMDNDDLRRGKPTCHKVYGEATAILVGDALQSLAFQILSDQNSKISESSLLPMLRQLALASGSFGMAGGQALDLKATGQHFDASHITQIHRLKTGALIMASVELGLLAAGVHNDVLSSFNDFAGNIGLCFQIQDDILDTEGSLAQLGKNVRMDQANDKSTFTTSLGLEKAKEKLQEHYELALDALQPYQKEVVYLKGLADYIINRDH